jgi:hypothetical protein
MSDLEIMSANLQAIYSVAHKPLFMPPKQAASAPIDKGIAADKAVILTPVPAQAKAPLKAHSEPNLVANYSGTRIYNTAHCWGRVWTIIYKILGFFAGESLQIRKLKEAIIKTNDIFNEHRVHIAEHLKKYEKYIRRCLDRKIDNCTEEEISVSRNAITAWNDSTKPFLKFMKKNGLKTILDVFRHNLKLRPTERLHFLYPPIDGKIDLSKALTDKKGASQAEGKPEEASKKGSAEVADPSNKAPEPEKKEEKAAQPDASTLTPEQFRKALAEYYLAQMGEAPPKEKPVIAAPVLDPFGVELLETAIKYQRIIDLQGMHPDPQPHFFFNTLASMAKGQHLYVEQERKRDKFVQRLNELYDKKELSPRYLHKMLESIVEILATHDGEKELPVLEYLLVEHGCKLFHLEDPIHMKWRNQLKPCDKILMTEQNGNKKEITLGQQVGTKKEGDRNVYFKIVKEDIEEYFEKILEKDVIAEGNIVLGKAGEQLTEDMLKRMIIAEVKTIRVFVEFLTEDVVTERNIVLGKAGEQLTKYMFKRMKTAGVETIPVVTKPIEITLTEETLVWMHINPMILPIKKHLRHNYKVIENGALGVVDFRGMDKDGRFALVDRLKYPLQNIAWETNGMTSMNKKACFSIIKLIKAFIAKEQTPEHFSPKFLMFDKNGLLKCTRIPKQGKNFDFNAIEDFILELSKNNLAIFQHIMSETGLTKLESALFYRKMVANALNGDSTPADKVAAQTGAVEPTVVDRGQELFKAVIALKKHCCERLKKAAIAGDLEAQVTAQIQLEYSRTCAAGKLWPDLEEKVVAQLARGAENND